MEFDLTKTVIHRCAKCGVATNIRHHMGNDKYYGKFNKSIKRNYKNYSYCVYLCLTCHAIIHVIYRQENLHGVERKRFKKPEVAANYRLRCISVCKKWLKGKDYGVTQYDYRVLDQLRYWEKQKFPKITK